MRHMAKVKGYTISTCPWCKKTKKWFSDHGIDFEYVDYDLAGQQEKKRIESEMNKHKGPIAFPYIVIRDEVVVGFHPDKWAELLGVKD